MGRVAASRALQKVEGGGLSHNPSSRKPLRPQSDGPGRPMTGVARSCKGLWQVGIAWGRWGCAQMGSNAAGRASQKVEGNGLSRRLSTRVPLRPQSNGP